MTTLQNDSPLRGEENKIETSQEHLGVSSETTQPVDIPNEYVPLPSQSIHWKSEDESKLDLGYHDKIGMIYKGVLWGSVLTIGFTFFDVLVQFENYGLLAATLVIAPSMILGILGIIGALGIEKRKPNAVFLCLVYSWICTIINAVNVIASLAFGQFPGLFAIFWLIYGIAIISALYSSDDVKVVFPREYRKVSASDMALAFVCIFFEAVILMLAIVGLMAG
jgi:hypothetical protein